MEKVTVDTLNAEEKHCRFIGMKQHTSRTDIGPTHMIVDGLLTDGLHILSSPPKAGKSTIMTQLAFCITGNDDFLGRKTEHGAVIHIENEASEKTVYRKALRVAGEREISDNYVFALDSPYITDPQFFIEIQQQIDIFKARGIPTVLVILDMYVNALDPKDKRNGTAYTMDYEKLMPIQKFALENELCFTVINHTRKAEEGSTFNKVSGSMGMIGATSTNWLLTERGRNKHQVLYVQGREIEDCELTLIMDCEQGGFHIVGEEDLKDTLTYKEYKADSITLVIKFLLSETPRTVVTCNDLKKESERVAEIFHNEKLVITDSVTLIGKKLTKYAPFMEAEGLIGHEAIRDREGRKHIFYKRDKEI